MSEYWHTDLPSDPWLWRMNIERDGKAAYAKLFDKKPGFISLKLYPKFLAVHEIKSLGGFTKELNSKYESAMCELQMAMFITVNGTKQKISAKGEPYGWPSTAYSTVETWAGDRIIDESNTISAEDAMNEILERIREYAPGFQKQD